MQQFLFPQIGLSGSLLVPKLQIGGAEEQIASLLFWFPLFIMIPSWSPSSASRSWSQDEFIIVVALKAAAADSPDLCYNYNSHWYLACPLYMDLRVASIGMVYST